MRQAAWLVALVALATAQQCPPYDTLERTSFLPHARECASFWRCLAGQLVPGRCPPGLHFSPARAECLPPSRAGCRACAPEPPAQRCDSRCTCLRADRARHCPYSLQFGAHVDLIDLALRPACREEPNSFPLTDRKLGRLAVRNRTAALRMCDVRAGQTEAPHLADCSRGVSCPAGEEVEVEVTCPHGSLYSARLGRCTEAARADCPAPGAPEDCPGGAPLRECRVTCTCEALRGPCPARLRFAATVGVFRSLLQPACLPELATLELDGEHSGVLSLLGNSTRVNHCPLRREQSPSFYPDPASCGRMFECHAGRETSRSCPRGQHFDPATGGCGAPDPAVCDDSPAPPAPEQVGGNLTCPAPATCPASHAGRLAHPTDCSLFCRCVRGAPFLRACAPGLHFSARARVCESPRRAGCQALCGRLAAVAGGSWSRPECEAADGREGDECRLRCEGDRQPVGSEVITCTARGWHGTGGLSLVPACRTPQEIAEEIVNKINETLHQHNQTKIQDTALLFILDESRSVKTSNFQIEKDFISALVNIFPLSRDRSAGVMSFSGRSAVDIGLDETSTCRFLSRLGGVRYSSGRTDIARVLRLAAAETDARAPNKTTLIFLVTDGRSQTDPVEAAQVLKSQNRVLFMIGVARYVREQVEPISSTYRDGSKLFFGLPSFRVFKVVADYLKTKYTQGAEQECSNSTQVFTATQ
ncbi:uncharacterized protein LOC134531847 [Bacillus rossius redtenbacheri]|uniref:uncharacterized protein LOC134531847 n=1 Tax=Bacillus rossius redtenbacheri TaxID=93214 RepID=UPI002FDEE654